VSGARINAQDKSGNTALILAAKQGKHNVVKTLLQNCANTRIYDVRRKTALKWAQEKKRAQILQLLKAAKPCD
jgi:ankyrin repeat protein